MPSNLHQFTVDLFLQDKKENNTRFILHHLKPLSWNFKEHPTFLYNYTHPLLLADDTIHKVMVCIGKGEERVQIIYLSIQRTAKAKWNFKINFSNEGSKHRAPL